jgi:hypothetical protein
MRTITLIICLFRDLIFPPVRRIPAKTVCAERDSAHRASARLIGSRARRPVVVGRLSAADGGRRRRHSTAVRLPWFLWCMLMGIKLKLFFSAKLGSTVRNACVELMFSTQHCSPVSTLMPPSPQPPRRSTLCSCLISSIRPHRRRRAAHARRHPSHANFSVQIRYANTK